jgi:HEAT repeat protein
MKQFVLFGLALVVLEQLALAQESFLGRTPEEWNTLLTSGKGQRVEAAWALAQIAGRASGGPGDHIAFSELVKLVSDSDASVRYWGCLGLAGYARQLKTGDSGRGAAINALTPLLDDKAVAPRLAAAAAIGQLGQAGKALPVLVAAMKDPQDATRIQAVAALELLGAAARPAEPTLRAATTDSSEYVKRISARALEKLQGGPAGLPMRAGKRRPAKG